MTSHPWEVVVDQVNFLALGEVSEHVELVVEVAVHVELLGVVGEHVEGLRKLELGFTHFIVEAS